MSRDQGVVLDRLLGGSFAPRREWLSLKKFAEYRGGSIEAARQWLKRNPEMPIGREGPHGNIKIDRATYDRYVQQHGLRRAG